MAPNTLLSVLQCIFIRMVCSSIVNTTVFDLERGIRGEYGLPGTMGRNTTPGVTIFHQHIVSRFTVFSGDRPVKHTLEQRKEHCYYQGQLRNNMLSHAALSSCDGFRGYVSDGHETYHIDPVKDSLHRIFRQSDQKHLPFKCGTESRKTHHRSTDFLSQHARKKRSIHAPYDANKSTRYVELYLVSDYRTYDRYGKNATVVFKRSQDIANIVNSLYRQLNIYVVLVGAEVWSTGDRISVTSNADDTMENFLRYRKERINPFKPNDNAQLITSILFDHGVVGKAIKGPICTHQFSGGVSMDYDGLVTLVATTVAHEMGHNFGMEHDNDTRCSCPQDRCIMAATSGRISPQYWSSCSQYSLHEAFELGMDYCLRNIPEVIFDGPVCGNGMLEDGEECDCGLPEDCSNRCCNATSCQLYSQAQCGAGQCCDFNTCKLKEVSTLCRPSKGECDLSEYCNGTSEFCPPDVYIQDGRSCGNGQSYCYRGKCNTHNAQCKLLWGSTGRVSDPLCFQQLNVKGNRDGNCGYNWVTERYQSCERENVLCGLLHCVHLNEKLMFWRDNLALDMRANFLTRGNTQYVCRSTMLDVGLDMPDPGLVPDGAKCEDNKICIRQTCTPLMKLQIPQCPDCHGNGVCNSKGHCHCEVGYKPPLCDRPGFGGSIDSGPATNEYAKRDLLIGLLVLFLVIIPLMVLAILAFINRRRLINWWKVGANVKFSSLKKPQRPPQPPRPRPGAAVTQNSRSKAPSSKFSKATLEISGPLLEDAAAGDNDRGHMGLPSSGRPPPIYKPSAKVPPPKPRPPALSQTERAAPVVGPLAGREHQSFVSTKTAGHSQPAADGTASSTTRLTRPTPINIAAPSGPAPQRREGEAKRMAERPGSGPPPSPTKGGRKLVHSQCLREPQADHQGQDKIAKRQSFRGAEISCPILVSTTNRDSEVFSDFELDQSGIIARPVTKQHSIHGSRPSTDVAKDGCRSPVRRSQSDRPLTSKVKTSDPAVKTGQQGARFVSRPLPEEPVLEAEPALETEPLYMNEGLSDLGDLEAHISSAFDALYLNLPTQESTTQPEVIHKPASAVSSVAPGRPRHTPAAGAASSGSSMTSKVSQPKSTGPPRLPPGSAGTEPKPSLIKAAQVDRLQNKPAPTKVTPLERGQNNSVPSKATPVERVQNNPVPSKATPLERVQNNPVPSKATPLERVQNNPDLSKATPLERVQNNPVPSKATPLERVLNNPVKSPFSSKGPLWVSSDSQSADRNTRMAGTAQGKTAPTSGSAAEAEAKPMESKTTTEAAPTTFTAKVRGPLGGAMNWSSGSSEGSRGPAGLSARQGSASPAPFKPASAAVSSKPVISTGNTRVVAGADETGVTQKADNRVSAGNTGAGTTASNKGPVISATVPSAVSTAATPSLRSTGAAPSPSTKGIPSLSSAGSSPSAASQAAVPSATVKEPGPSGRPLTGKASPADNEPSSRGGRLPATQAGVTSNVSSKVSNMPGGGSSPAGSSATKPPGQPSSTASTVQTGTVTSPPRPGPAPTASRAGGPSKGPTATKGLVLPSSTANPVSSTAKTGGGSSTSKTGAISSLAKTGAASDTPKTGAVSDTPKTGAVSSTPKTGAVSSTPKAGAVSSTPKTGAVSSTPKTGAVSSTPKTGAVSSTPKTGAVSSTPKAGAVSSTPKTGAVSSTPKAGAVSSTPKTGAVSSTPKTGAISSLAKAGAVSSTTRPGPTSTASRTAPSKGAPSKGLAAADTSAAKSSSAKPTGRGAGSRAVPHGSTTGATPPSVLPKTAAGKSVRSYNF